MAPLPELQAPPQQMNPLHLLRPARGVECRDAAEARVRPEEVGPQGLLFRVGDRPGVSTLVDGEAPSHKEADEDSGDAFRVQTGPGDSM